jgi:hypothetical protein
MGRGRVRRAKAKEFSLENAIAALEEDVPEIQARREQLVTALKRFPNATLRDDSQLAFQYIAAQGDGAAMSAETVATEMACVQHLYSETEYGTIVQHDMRLVAEWAKTHYQAVPWADIWAIVRETFVPACKVEATIRLLRSRRLKESARAAACGPEAAAVV